MSQSDSTVTSATPVAPAPRRRWRRLMLLTLAFVVVSLGIIVVALPTILSTGPGTRWLTSIVNRSIPGSVSIGDLSLAWGRGQHIRNLTLLDNRGEPVAHVTQMDAAQLSLWSLLRGHYDVGDVKVDVADATIRQNPDGSLNLLNALVSPDAATREPGEPSDPVDYQVKLDLTVRHVTVIAPGIEPVHRENVAFTGDLQSRGGSMRADVALNMADVSNLAANVDVRGNTTTLTPSSNMQIRVTPETWGLIVAMSGRHDAPALVQPFAIDLQPKDFVLPVTNGRLDIRAMRGELKFAVQDIVLQAADQRIGRVGLTGTQGSVSTIGHDELRATFSAGAFQNDHAGKLALNISARNYVDSQGAFDLALATVNVNGQVEQLPLAAIDQLASLNGLLVAALGTQVQANVHADLRPVDGKLAGTFKFTTSSANMDTAINGKFQGDSIIIDPSPVNMTISPQTLAAIFAAYPTIPQSVKDLGLRSPAVISLNIDSMNIPFTGDMLRDTRFALTALVKNLALIGDPRLQDMSIDELRLQVPSSSLTQQVQADISGNLNRESQRVPLTMSVTASRPLDANVRSLTSKLSIDKLPVSLVDTLLNYEGLLPVLFGATFDRVAIELNQKTPGGPYQFTGNIQSRLLQVNTSGEYAAEQSFTLADNGTIQWTLTPEALVGWQDRQQVAQTDRLTLARAVKLSLVPQRLALALLPATEQAVFRFDTARSTLLADLISEPIALRRAGDTQPLQVQNLKLNINSTNLHDLITVRVDADVIGQPAQTQQPTIQVIDQSRTSASNHSGKLVSDTRIRHLFSTDGVLDKANAVYETRTESPGMPIMLVEQFTGMSGKLVSVLGPVGHIVVAGTYAGTRPGTLDVDVRTDYAQAKVRAITGETIRLAEDLHATLVVRPELSRTMLSSFNPYLKAALYGREPMKLVIRKENFSLPLGENATNKMKADVELELGTLVLDMADWRPLLNILKMTIPPEYDIAVTPVKARVENGVITYSNLGMTINNMQFGFSGRVDYAKDEMDLNIQIPGEAMKNIRELQSVIPAGYTMTIPLRGTTTKPVPDLGALTGEIAKLSAKALIQKNLKGSEGGAAAGLLDQLLGGTRRSEQPQE